MAVAASSLPLDHAFCPDREGACFHCGLPVPGASSHRAAVDGAERSFCCVGCQAVAETIEAAGLVEFYRQRDDWSPRPALPDLSGVADMSIYDREDLQQGLVECDAEQQASTSLILEGLTCAACAWLSERHVNSIPGVLEFRVNYATHRASLRWDRSRTSLAGVLEAVARIGFRAHPFDPGRRDSIQRQEQRTALRRLAVAALGMVQVMMLAVALYAGHYAGMTGAMQGFLRWVSLLITVPVLLYAAQPFFRGLWRDLRYRHLSMDVPVSLALGGAFAISVWFTWRGGGEVYYDSVTMFTFFLLSSRFLEMAARHRVGLSVEERLHSLPALAIRVDEDGAEAQVPVAALQAGDRVLLRPGDTVPADGRISEGEGSVDEALLSGESLPVRRRVGDRLVGGAVNVESPLVMTVEAVGKNTTLAGIVALLERVQSERPRLAQLTDRVAGYFVAVVLLVATVVAVYWGLIAGAATAAEITLAVLVVTCPCALSLATPTALAAAVGSLTRSGLLVTSGEALETLGRATHMLFDKTGTLTWGRLRVERVVSLVDGLSEERLLALAAALERGSEHPLGRAIRNACDTPPGASEIHNTPGRGVAGTVDGTRYRLGSAGFVGIHDDADEQDAPGLTRVWLADQTGPLGRLELADQVRAEAPAVVASLKTLGLRVGMLSGDRPAAARALARRLDIDHAQGGLSPTDKLAAVRQLQSREAVVAMVGDGINDAPVLGAAQVSVAMGTGTQLAQASADLVLLSESLETLHEGVTIARRTRAIIAQNMGWAILYNVIALPLAASGWLAPWMAAIGMSLSSLLVVANAFRLRYPTR